MTVYADGSCYCTYANPPVTSMTLMLGVGALTTSEATSIAASLVAVGQSHAIIRIMWEQNQDVNGWFTDWSQLSLTSYQYIATFQNIVTTMRAVPGAAFRFMWNPNGGSGNEASGRTWNDTWPGTGYVNYVGVDQYDYSGYSTNIQTVVAFAQSQGLPAAIPEWGLNGSDDTSYMSTMIGLIQNPANDIGLQAYFSYDGSPNSDITQFPHAEALYTSAFSGSATRTTTTTSPGFPSTTPPSTSTTIPTDQPHVMVIPMENRNYSAVIGNSDQPTTNTLASDYGLATNDFAFGHPSLPNYLDLISGSSHGVTDDNPPSSHSFGNSPTLATQLVAAGFTIKAYAENLPADPTNDSGNYAVRHFPWEYFSNPPPTIADSTQLLGDLNSPGAPDFVWYTPNLVNDEHDGTDQQGDQFLSSFVSAVQATTWYKSGGQIIITWDESATDNTNGGGQVPTIVVSAALKAAPARVTSFVDTQGILHSIEDTYGLAHLGGSSADGTIDALLQPQVGTPPTTTTTHPSTPTTTSSTIPTTTTSSPPVTVPPEPTTTTTSPPPVTVPPAPTTTTTSPPPPPVTVPTPQPTVTTVTLAPDAQSAMQILTITVSPVPDGGTVSFSVDGQALAEAKPVNPDGTFETILNLTNGPHTVAATYSGTAKFQSSTVDMVLTVGQTPTTLTASPPTLSGTGQQYWLSATLTSGGTPLPDAWVSFTTSDSPLCHTKTNDAGLATCSVDSSPLGTLSLTTTGYTAIFLGDSNHLPAYDHAPIFGGGHQGDREGSHGRSWRRSAAVDSSSPDSGGPSTTTGQTGPTTSAAQTGGLTAAPWHFHERAEFAITDTSRVETSGSWGVAWLFVLLGTMFFVIVLRKRLRAWTVARFPSQRQL